MYSKPRNMSVLTKAAACITALMLLLPMLVFTALPNTVFGYGSTTDPEIAGFTASAQRLSDAYQSIERKNQPILERLINSILPNFSDYDDYQVTDGSGGMNQNWLIAIGSVRYKQDLNTMDEAALEDLIYGKLDWSASITDRVLNISVWDLTPEKYMDRLGFSEEEKKWAALLYSVMAEDQSVTISDTDGTGYYGTDYGDITFSNAETPVVYYNQTDARWGNKPYGKTSTIGRAGCGPTALATSVQWVIEGDIKACFDSFDHHVLIDILRRRIKDEHFIALMWKMLKAGYMEQWTYHHTYSGTPQGSGVSPILANIYLNELDIFLENYKCQFNVGTCRRSPCKTYSQIAYQYKVQKECLGRERTTEAAKMFKETQKRLLDTPYYTPADPNYKSLRFNRYADDFVVGIIGSHADAERAKADIRDFLANTLKLTLSEEKTKITHSSELIDYLGYQFTIRRSKDVKRDRNGVLRRVWYGKAALYVPHDKWVQKLKEYQAFKIVSGHDGKERWIPMHRGKLMHKDAIAILSQFNSEIRGLYNYYSMAENVSVLNSFYFIMKGSFLKTLAAKGSTTRSKIREKYEHDGVISIPCVTKSGLKSYEFYHDGFTKKKVLPSLNADTLPQYAKYDKPNSLSKRLKTGVCELCGTKTKEIHMHHVRRLKDLTGKNELELKMMQMRRKSIALCPKCYETSKQ